MAEARVTLPGSEVAPPSGAPMLGPVDRAERAEVSIYLKPVGGSPSAADHAGVARHRAAVYGDDLSAIAAYATGAGLTVTETDPARRLLRVAGPVGTLADAFGADVALYGSPVGPVRARTGALTLPANLAGKIEAVLGLDGRQVATTKLAFPSASVAGFLPSDVARLYGVPVGPTLGQGQTIAIVELGGGFRASDTAAAFAAMGLPAPNVVAVGVGGAINAPGGDADGEVALDIQVAGAVAPGAAIAVYFAANTAQGFVDAISQAAHDSLRKPSTISISWGAPESGWSGQTVAAMNSAIADSAALGVTVCCASGDGLATDGISDGKAHVDFPASSVDALGCGGTRVSATGGRIASETVWNTGGGISDLFPVPAYQTNAGLPASVNGGRAGRGVPDVAADADPNSGFRIVLGGQTQVIGGTSAAAPLWAGLFAALNARAGKPTGAPHAVLYGAGGLRDIVQGNNRAGGIGYDAGPGWDACTGLGSPDWMALTRLFS